MSDKTLTIALAGNPNCGKTTLFNAITGSRLKVGNYPGVTVEKIEGTVTHNDTELHIVDLPGTYSLTAHSIDEVVARNFIIDEQPDVVVGITDASNLERNLYLCMQLLELGVPVVIALNMSDVAKARGYRIDAEKLSALLGVPVVPTVATESEGIDDLLETVIATANDPEAMERLRLPNYGTEVEPHVKELTAYIAGKSALARRPRWYAVKLLEDDDVTIKHIKELCPDDAEEILARGLKLRSHIESICGDSTEIILADRRYGYISGACTEAVTHTVEARHDLSDQIDKVLTHPILGLPIFGVMMYLVFQLTFLIGGPLSEMLGELINEDLVGFISSHWEGDSLLRSLVLKGIITGVGSVFMFVPLIVLMFLGIAILEDSGYMARAAFIMDRVMHKIGLHGKSFVPMLIGFGCTVPGIMATRTLESKRDRLTTIMILPLMSCGARIPIYTLILAAFFPTEYRTPMMCGIYFIGIVIAVIVARLFRATILRGEAAPFVMELPPYRMPTVKGMFLHMWERIWMYVRKAGTIILVASIILWALATFPRKTEFDQDYDALAKVVQVEIAADVAAIEAATPADAPAAVTEKSKQRIAQIAQNEADRLAEIVGQRESEKLQYTIAGRVGKFMEPVVKTMGFDWKIGTALIGAFAAKEVFVSQMGIVYSMGEDVDEKSVELQTKLQKTYSPLVGFCIMLFCLISLPCVATFAVTVRETQSWKWGFFQAGYLTVLAWLVTTVVYQVGSLFL
ncbi:MAG: ferrous iron transport protein B [Phycisphaerae bacterium]|nr:ferrous iron transport protein B [Phycisphaerae bacterium]